MIILYVAKHNSGGNDDEGAIAYALEQLGHTVICIPEKEGLAAARYKDYYDLVLCHSWPMTSFVRRCKKPVVFWYFDLVDFPDPEIQRRCEARKRWIEGMTRVAFMGFCTDGDWVNKDTTGKLVRLTQGMDERKAGLAVTDNGVTPLLFTGMVNGGIKRRTHIEYLKNRYKDSLRIVDGKNRVHGRELAQLFANHLMVIAPDGPVTDQYWSNRVYLTLGLGGFLLHPYAATLTHQYTPNLELVMYNSREQLDERIQYYASHSDEIRDIKIAGYQRTMKEHTYRHRCEELIRIVKERL